MDTPKIIIDQQQLIKVDEKNQIQIQKQIQQTKCVRKLKNKDGINADGIQNMFVLTILEKIKERD